MSSLIACIIFQVVASYFSLKCCIEGLKVLAESLFAVKFQEIPLGPGESWHPDVLKLSLHHPDEVNKWLYAHLFAFGCLSSTRLCMHIFILHT